MIATSRDRSFAVHLGPHPACCVIISRNYDYLLGGKDNFAADRNTANPAAGRQRLRSVRTGKG
jgi:hypothetical protein